MESRRARWARPVHTPADIIPPYTPILTMDERNDNNYTVGLSLAYSIQDWLRVGVSYNLYVKDSNYNHYDFTDNKGTVWVKAAY